MASSDPQSSQPPSSKQPLETVDHASWLTSPATAIIAASIATILIWRVVDRSYGVIPWPAMSEAYLKEAEAKYADLSKLSEKSMAEYNTKEQMFLHRNAGLAIGLFGALMGIIFGALAGRERLTTRATVTGAIGGGLIGAMFGVAGGYGGAQVARISSRFAVKPTSAAEMSSVWLREMYTSIAIHSAVWCLVGIGLGIVVAKFGNPVRSVGRSIGMAVGAGLIAAALYTPLASLCVPKVPSGLTIPSDTAARGIGSITVSPHELSFARLLFVLLPAVTLSLMLLAQRGSKRHQAGQPVEAV